MERQKAWEIIENAPAVAAPPSAAALQEESRRLRAAWVASSQEKSALTNGLVQVARLGLQILAARQAENPRQAVDLHMDAEKTAGRPAATLALGLLKIVTRAREADVEAVTAAAVETLAAHHDRLAHGEKEPSAAPTRLRRSAALTLFETAGDPLRETHLGTGLDRLRETLEKASSLCVEAGDRPAVRDLVTFGHQLLELRGALEGKSAPLLRRALTEEREAQNALSTRRGYRSVQAVAGELLLMGHYLDIAQAAHAGNDPENLLKRLGTVHTLALRAMEHHGGLVPPAAPAPILDGQGMTTPTRRAPQAENRRAAIRQK